MPLTKLSQLGQHKTSVTESTYIFSNPKPTCMLATVKRFREATSH